MAIKLLLVEDEADIREPLAQYLSRNGCKVAAVENAARAREAIAASHVDIVVSDIMMPGEDGISLCRHIQETAGVPVIFLTARAEEVDRIVGIEIGADDYIVKPFNPRELLARINAVMRRVNALPPRQAPPDSDSYTFGDWVLRTGPRDLLQPDGASVPLSTGEFTLLLTFLERPKIVLTRDQLLDLTKGREAGQFDRSIDNQISRLRRKIEPDPKAPQYIKTVWGGGYVFSVDVRRL